MCDSSAPSCARVNPSYRSDPPGTQTTTHLHSLLYLAYARHGAFEHDALSTLAFLFFYTHVAWVHAPASVACHLIGNAGISKHVHELSLELDYVCIFLASVRALMDGWMSVSWVGLGDRWASGQG